jgi:hypothetical protein
MVELTDCQQKAVDTETQPLVLVDPRTGQEYVLIRREIYELVRGMLKSYGRGWDDPADDDSIRKVGERRGLSTGRGDLKAAIGGAPIL